ELEAMLEKAYETPDIPIAHENDNICRDGRRVRILWKNSLLSNAAGEVTGCQSVGHDLTEQRMVEASLLAAEREFHQLINVSPVPLAILEHKHKFIYLNQRFTETFGYTLEDLPTVDDWWVNCYPDPHYREEVMQKWLHAVNMASEPEVKFSPQEARVTCKNGTVLDVVARQASIGDKEIVVLNNMSRERQLDRLKSGFITTAAHELNTPLTSILGFTELLLGNDGLERATQKEYLAIVLDKTEALVKIVDDLLELNIAKDGRNIRIEKEPGDLRDLVTGTRDAYQKEFCDRQFPLAWPVSGAMKASFDRVKIARVLENLLSNAIKFSPRGTPIMVGCSQSDCKVRISVSNQGQGMTPEQAGRAFERFYRADTSNAAVPGLGLGLSIAKEIIEAHGGTIDIHSRPGEGAEASFVLPMEQ
ncbi:MAG: PAS domain-containing sensor histidine kinase, partial [Desulfuromonadales bacterium]|nr:PAS domain-containing sensor histidine kinase [Desulfuromonadales bacterium]